MKNLKKFTTTEEFPQNPFKAVFLPQNIIEPVDDSLLCFNCKMLAYLPEMCQKCQRLSCPECKSEKLFCFKCNKKRNFCSLPVYLVKYISNLHTYCRYGCGEVVILSQILSHEQECLLKLTKSNEEEMEFQTNKKKIEESTIVLKNKLMDLEGKTEKLTVSVNQLISLIKQSRKAGRQKFTKSLSSALISPDKQSSFSKEVNAISALLYFPKQLSKKSKSSRIMSSPIMEEKKNSDQDDHSQENGSPKNSENNMNKIKLQIEEKKQTNPTEIKNIEKEGENNNKYLKMHILTIKKEKVKDIFKKNDLFKNKLDFKNYYIENDEFYKEVEGAASCFLGNKYYISGGVEKGISSKFLFSLSFDQSIHCSSLGKMNIKRSFHGICPIELEGMLLVAGGIEEPDYDTNECEIFSVQENEWFRVPPLQEKKFGVSLCILDDDVYCIGGKTYSEKGMIFHSIETKTIFPDPEENKWNTIIIEGPNFLLQNRSMCVSLIFSNNILIFGGEQNNNPTTDCFRISLSDRRITDQSTPLKQAAIFHNNYSAPIIFGDEIFAVDSENNIHEYLIDKKWNIHLNNEDFGDFSMISNENESSLKLL